MKILKITGPIVAGLLAGSLFFYSAENIIKRAYAVTVPKTFVNGEVLQASDLNSNNTTIYNAFNSHTHDGNFGEASTLDDQVFAGIITPTLNIGDGTSTEVDATSPGVTVRTNTGDAKFSLKLNNSTSNQWDILANNDQSDRLELRYNTSSVAELSTAGNLDLDGGLSTDANGSTHRIGWKKYSGTSPGSSGCSAFETNFPDSTNGPLFGGCTYDAGLFKVDFNRSLSTTANVHCLTWDYDETNNDLRVCLDSDISCASLTSKSYRCTFFYEK